MQRFKKLAIILLAVFLVGLVPLTAAEMTVSWEWLLDDPDVTAYRYQLDGEDPDNWTVVSADTNIYEVAGLDPYQDYTLYVQRSYDGINWSESGVSTAKALLEAAPVVEEVVAEPEPVVVEEEPVVVAEPEPEPVIEEVVVEPEPVVVEEEVVEEMPVVEEVAPIAIAPLAPIAPTAIAEKPNELAMSLLIRPGVMFQGYIDGNDKFQLVNGQEGMSKYILGEFGLAFDVANLAQIGNHLGIGLRTDLLADFMGGAGWDLPEVKDYLDINNYSATASLDLKVMLDITTGPAVMYLGVGAGLMIPASEVSNYQGNIFTTKDNTFGLNYFLSGIAGVRFYIGDIFSIGVEGGYRYVPAKTDKTDFTAGQHLISGDLVFGFTF